YRVVVACPDVRQSQSARESGLRRTVLLEPARRRRLAVGRVALWIDRRLAALGRRQGDIGAGILEDVIGSGELLQPEARFAARVAQLVVRREHHQNVHGYLDFWLPRRSRFGGSRVAVASRAGIQSRSSRRNAGLASEPRARLDRYQLRETSRRTGSEPVSRG